MHRPFDRQPPGRTHLPPSTGDGVSQAWFESMASLAWLLERRLQTLGALGGKPRLECLRLRALVALMWWERLLPQDLSCWSLSDAERLVAATGEDAAMAVDGGLDGIMAWLLDRGPARAVLDWMEVAGVRSGPVFRRILPDGRVTRGALTPVGIAGLFAGLLMEGRNVGVIDRQFSLDFSQKVPPLRLKKPSYPPHARAEGRKHPGRLEAQDGQAPERAAQVPRGALEPQA